MNIPLSESHLLHASMEDESTTPESKMPMIAPLTQFSRDDLEHAGGKGANLGELLRAGFAIPPGFVMTTAAYDQFVAQNHLGETIARVLREPSLQGGGATIRDAFEAAPIPPGLEGNILGAYQQLRQGSVAVRSSATAEDLPQAAFAGQQDTFLNVIGEPALMDAVRRCWASLWSDRAIAYRERQGIDQETVKLAVIVQCMVAAEVAGVMFTANPVTGARDEIVIDASPGLGEAVVSGLVTPDHFVLRKRRSGWSIIERREGRREVIIQARSGGGTEHVEGSTPTNSPTLSDQALRRLAHLGAAIEQHFERPQDVEWAWAADQPFILQARPITALPEPPLRQASQGLQPHTTRPLRMLAAILSEVFPIRPYPLDQTTWAPVMLATALGRMFSVIGVAVLPIEQIFIEEDGVVVRFSGRLAFHLTPAILLAPVRLLWLARRYDPVHQRADPLLADARSRARSLEARDLQNLSWEGLLAIIREALELPLPLVGEMRRRYFPRALLAAGLLQVMLRFLGHGNDFGTLLSGVDSMTLEANRALEDLASRVRSNAVLADIFARHEAGTLHAALEAQPTGRAFLADLRVFFDRYGHREVVFSSVLQPTWKDDPEIVLGIIKGLARIEPQQATGRPAWEVARDAVLKHPLLRLSPLRSAFLGLLTVARYLLQIREDTHYDATRVLPILRRTLLEFGRRLVSVDVLNAPEDVFHLKLDELARIDGTWPPPSPLANELRAIVLRRKERRAALEGTPLIDPRLYSQVEPSGDALLRGTAGSPGVAEGPVRIIHDGSEFGKLRAGEVLVAPYTNPSWTPLFQRAVAVVVNGGGAGSHAAIVAREYGIPAVMGTGNGTQKLHDGEWVQVDGHRGLVLKTKRPK